MDREYSREYTVVYQDSWISGSHHFATPKYQHIIVKGNETLASVITRVGLSPLWVLHGHIREVNESY